MFSVSARENKLSCCPHSFEKRVPGRYSLFGSLFYTHGFLRGKTSQRMLKIKSRRRDNFLFFFLELHKSYFYSTCFQEVCYFILLAPQYIKMF